MTIYRLHENQNDGASYVRSVVLAEDEVDEQLEVEARLHRLLGGWEVSDLPGKTRGIVCRSKNGTVRQIWAVPYDPKED